VIFPGDTTLDDTPPGGYSDGSTFESRTIALGCPPDATFPEMVAWRIEHGHCA
jgi:hypothetical protein